MIRLLATALALLVATPSFAAEIVCTGELLYKPANNPRMVMPATGPYTSMVRITRVDLETGAYTSHWFNTPDAVLASGTLAIVDKGSAAEYRDFVGVDTATGLYLRVTMAPGAYNFTRVEPEGGIQVGRCTEG